MSTLRTFIGVKISSTQALAEILDELSTMRPALKLVAADNLHITLKFLGETERSLVKQIDQVVTDVTFGKSVVDAELLGLGTFPHMRRPSVVWAGLAQAEVLVTLAGELEERLEPLGFAPERRAFRPHLTLARVKSKPPPELAELVDAFEETSFGAARIEAVTLFQSELRPQGPQYTALATAALSSSPAD